MSENWILILKIWVSKFGKFLNFIFIWNFRIRCFKLRKSGTFFIGINVFQISRPQCSKLDFQTRIWNYFSNMEKSCWSYCRTFELRSIFDKVRIRRRTSLFFKFSIPKYWVKVQKLWPEKLWSSRKISEMAEFRNYFRGFLSWGLRKKPTLVKMWTFELRNNSCRFSRRSNPRISKIDNKVYCLLLLIFFHTGERYYRIFIKN